jgi:FdrA protein
MTDHVIVRSGSYNDSARLMQIARTLQEVRGVTAAEVMMGTAANCAMLRQAGFAGSELDSASPMDMVIALRTEGIEAFAAAREKLASQLAGVAHGTATGGREQRPGSVAEAVALHPQANLVSIAVPGTYAAFVAHRALDAGRHVFLFSDNVPLGDEVTLKRRGRDLGLLVMGPDCGTAIIAGCGLGFANRVPRGGVGIVGASGTGIQEISCLLAQAGVGVSHAIGTGSRDLSRAVDGVMSELGLRMLAEDPATRVVVLVAKHPDKGVAEKLHLVLARLGKPAVVRYLGEAARPSTDGVHYAATLDEAASVAARLAHAGAPPPATASPGERPNTGPPVRPVNGRLVGLFGGGSLAAEARYVLATLGIEADEPAEPLRGGQCIPGSGNVIVDTGDDAYTVGRPHPMVDQAVRCALIRTAGADPAVGLILLDLVLGDGAHPDPAPELAAAASEARKVRRGTPLAVVCSLCGTDADPQDARRQRATLEAAGVRVAGSAAQAARAAAAMLDRGATGSLR